MYRFTKQTGRTSFDKKLKKQRFTSNLHQLMQKSVQTRENRIISAMSRQFQQELPIFKTNRNTNRKLFYATLFYCNFYLPINSIVCEYIDETSSFRFCCNHTFFRYLCYVTVICIVTVCFFVNHLLFLSSVFDKLNIDNRRQLRLYMLK